MTPRVRHVYTPEERVRAVELYRDHGPTKAAALFNAATGLDTRKNTITKWAKKAGITCTAEDKMAAAHKAETLRRQGVRDEVSGLLWDRAKDCLLEMLGASASDKRHLAWAAGSCVINGRLMEGESTSREEHLHGNVSESELDREIRGLLGDMAHREEATGAGLPGLLVGPAGEGEAATP